jgi:hypothetical protein
MRQMKWMRSSCVSYTFVFVLQIQLLKMVTITLLHPHALLLDVCDDVPRLCQIHFLRQYVHCRFLGSKDVATNVIAICDYFLAELPLGNNRISVKLKLLPALILMSNTIL